MSGGSASGSLSRLSTGVCGGLRTDGPGRSIMRRFGSALAAASTGLGDICRGVFRKIVDSIGGFNKVDRGSSIVGIMSSLRRHSLLRRGAAIVCNLKAGRRSLPRGCGNLKCLGLVDVVFRVGLGLRSFRGSLGRSPSSMGLLFVRRPRTRARPPTSGGVCGRRGVVAWTQGGGDE